MSDFEQTEDHDYLARRQNHSHIMASRAASPEARIIHSTLEAHYADTIKALDALDDAEARRYETAAIAAPLAAKMSIGGSFP